MTHPWDLLITGLPDPHLLQTYEWGQVKAKYGWSPFYAVWDASGEFHVAAGAKGLPSFQAPPVAAALILKKMVIRRGLAARLSILYAPKGPLLDWSNRSLRGRVLDDLQSLAKKQGAIFLKIDPDVVLGTGVPGSEADIHDENGKAAGSELERRGWLLSPDQIQFRNTVVIDLSGSEEEMLARMKQKTRYNVRLAEKKGVTIRTGSVQDLSLLFRMYAETSVRDGFVIRDEGYYQAVWKIFMAQESPRCEPLIAEVGREPVAAIFLFLFAGRAYYLYGMSREAHREKMPAYLLQWEAMRRAKEAGCKFYDLWGAPDEFNGRDSLWGVYRFKKGLGGHVVRTLGAWDYAPNKLWYKLYAEVMPRLLDVMRSRGKSQTRRTLEG
jgi:lipid II:glycine glycyltransferase (peptidoglycan interpeptide bridge formation enzyme)